MSTQMDKRCVSQIKEVLEHETQSPSERFVDFLLAQAQLPDSDPRARQEWIEMVREAVREFSRDRAGRKDGRSTAPAVVRTRMNLEPTVVECSTLPSDYYLG